MKFTLVILGSPATSQAPETALRFARALLAEGHQLACVFFHHDGVHAGNAASDPGADAQCAGAAWSELGERQGVELLLCAASAAHRGLFCSADARRRGRDQGNLLRGYSVAGLGQLVEAVLMSDRVVSFAP